jgi:Ca2+-binding EF-hand superfamily protein
MPTLPSTSLERHLALCLTLLFSATSNAQSDDLANSPAELLQRVDRNRDGRVSLSEYQRYLSRGFEAMDRNGDGIVAANELPAGTRYRERRELDLTTLEQRFARQFHALDRDRNGWLDVNELNQPPQR